MQETPNGFFYLCLPDDSLQICQEISKKTGKTVGEVIADSITHYAEMIGVSVS